MGRVVFFVCKTDNWTSPTMVRETDISHPGGKRLDPSYEYLQNERRWQGEGNKKPNNKFIFGLLIGSTPKGKRIREKTVFQEQSGAEGPHGGVTHTVFASGRGKASWQSGFRLLDA